MTNKVGYIISCTTHIETEKYTDAYLDDLFVEIFLDNMEDDRDESFFDFDEEEFGNMIEGVVHFDMDNE